jgi:hypothetical protein
MLTFASAAAVLGTGLAFDLVMLALLLPAVMLLECALSGAAHRHPARQPDRSRAHRTVLRAYPDAGAPSSPPIKNLGI